MSNILTLQAAAAERLARNLPSASTLRVAGIVPAQDAAAYASPAMTATFVGASTADFAVLLVDRSFLAAAGGSGLVGAVQAGDVLRPALEQAASAFDAGVLGEVREEDAAGLLSDPATAVFELNDGAAPFGWFAVRVRDNGAVPDPGFRSSQDSDMAARLGLISNVEMALTVEIGRTRMSVRDALALEPGRVIELDRSAGAPADVLLNGRLIAHGEVVVVDQDYAVRITRILDGSEGTF
ncbi:flagellar motor switch protein FliN [Paenarthrobacter nitroguajacolicus]|uniref:Flagellar motor switch protein FliN n=1 Tax=Paenarthrobacter nitroguajacolicus TaxID=211146 RepID=A0A558GS55_PAENT|nr:flagellar motor switch protein FliN [Paenarthrobacter nitroguajacolicus]TVU59715.1 flagellar motor switch protein FliN [Paenarthrobacter nitroguajacolicus]